MQRKSTYLTHCTREPFCLRAQSALLRPRRRCSFSQHTAELIFLTHKEEAETDRQYRQTVGCKVETRLICFTLSEHLQKLEI